MILITQSQKELQQIMSDYIGIVRNDVRYQGHETARPVVRRDRIALSIHKSIATIMRAA